MGVQLNEAIHVINFSTWPNAACSERKLLASLATLPVAVIATPMHHHDFACAAIDIRRVEGELRRIKCGYSKTKGQ